MDKHTQLFISAFEHDPLFSFVFEDENKELTKQTLEWYFGNILEYCRRHGQVIITPDELGIISWVGDKHFPPHFDKDIMENVDKKILEKMQRYEELHEHFLEDYIVEHGINFGYIALLAVDDKARGKGYAKSLINDALNQMKAKGLNQCWLTTENAENIKFYEKNGFRLVHQITTNLGVAGYFFSIKLSD